MKKIAIGIGIVICGLAFALFVNKAVEKRVTAADFLPADVLFYGEQLDFTEMYLEFKGSRLGQVLADVDYNGVAAELGGDESLITEFAELRKTIDETLNSSQFDILFGKEVSVALFSAKSFAAAGPAKALEERLLLITKPRGGFGVLKFLAPLLSRDIPQSQIQYGSHTITRYQLDGEKRLSTATVSGIVLAAFDERLVRKGIDSYDDGTSNLSSNPDFKRMRKSFHKATLFTYLSLPSLYDQGRMMAEELEESDKKEFLSLLGQWEGLGAAAYGAWHEEGIIRDKIEILYDRDRLNPTVAELFSVSPVNNGTLAFLPLNTFFYYWTNTVNVPLIWDMYMKTMVQQQPRAVQLLRQDLKKTEDVELEDLLGMIGKEFAVIFRDIDREGVPLPKVAGVVQLLNPQRFYQIFNTLLAEAEIPISTKNYKGYDISFWGVAPQDGLQPAFCLFGDYFLLSNSYELLKQIIALSDDPEKTLMNGPEVAEVWKELVQENNSAAYIDIAHLADALKELVTWAGTMAVLQGPETGRKAEIVVKQLILPFLDGLGMYSQLGSRSAIDEDSFVVESTITVVQ